MNLGIVGCGHWGYNHLRNFYHLPDCTVSMCSDIDKERLQIIKESYPQIEVYGNYQEIIKSPKIDAVVVATPTSTHYQITKECLLNDKDVLCEKPLCTSMSEANELLSIAEQKQKILMVGHIFMFNEGIKKLKEYIENDELGEIYYMQATRTNLGPIRNDVNVVWDLATHDVSIFLFLLNSYPIEVTAIGKSYIQKNIEDITFITLIFPSGIIGNIQTSWLHPRKIRELTLIGTKKMVVWDDVNIEEPIRIYDKGVTQEPYYKDFREFQLLLREGNVSIPKIKLVEPLRNQSLYFLECFRKRTKPIVDGSFGLQVVKVASAIQESIKNNGKIVRITK